jgi:hypothetical protein
MATITEVRRNLSPSELVAQQVTGRVTGYPVFAWDHRNNQFGVLNQGFLAEVCVLAEVFAVVGRVAEDESVTVAKGSVVGDTATAYIEVPAGELWFLSRIAVTCPAAGTAGTNGGSCSYNIAISIPGVPEFSYYSENQTNMGATTNIDLFDPDEMGTRLRLPAGSKITLNLLVTVDFDVDKDFTIAVYGTKNRRIV